MCNTAKLGIGPAPLYKYQWRSQGRAQAPPIFCGVQPERCSTACLCVLKMIILTDKSSILTWKSPYCSDFQPKLKPYKCSTYSIQIIFAAQEIHIGASLMFVAHSKPKIRLKEVKFHFSGFSIQKMALWLCINMYSHNAKSSIFLFYNNFTLE